MSEHQFLVGIWSAFAMSLLAKYLPLWLSTLANFAIIFGVPAALGFAP